jgi:hypothetical protein
MSSSFNCAAAEQYSLQERNVREIEEQIFNMAIEIIDKINYLQSQGVTLDSDMRAFKARLQTTIAQSRDTYDPDITNSALSGMLSDVDLMVLQENTRYLFLSIFAVGVMVVALNAIKK